MNCPVEVTKTCKVAVERVLVASTRKLVFERSYSTREIVIVSAAGEVGLIVKVAARDVPLRVALICAEVVEVTCVVVIEKFALIAPAATVTLVGTFAAALPLAN